MKKTASFVNMIDIYVPGDIVAPTTYEPSGSIHGVVEEVNPKINKVFVLWSTGALLQHDPEEIQFAVHLNNPEDIKMRNINKMHYPKSVMIASAKDIENNIVANEVKAANIVANVTKNIVALYFKSRGRNYTTSKSEKESGIIKCSKCKEPMAEHGFTKSSKIHICPKCGWKITSDKVI